MNRNELRAILKKNAEMAGFFQPDADRRTRDALQFAYDAWQNSIATASEVALATVEASTESVEIAAVAEVKASEFVVKAIEVLTSPTAIGVYKAVFKAVAVAIAFSLLMAFKAAQWVWEHRQDAAVWHWVNDAIDSEAGQAAIENALIVWWSVAIVVGAWAEVAGEWRDRLVGQVQSIGVSGLKRLGLEGWAIEIQ